MGVCFVIQPFDKGKFDKRYEDVYEPALRAADLEPYRVDRDPAASVPIDEIEKHIRESDVVLADITVDNPNVWYEVGFAFAAGKEVVLLCSSERLGGKFPFDIQHRKIITYTTDSTSDFDRLKQRITERLRAVLTKRAHIATLAELSPMKPTQGLSPHEIAALVAVAESCFNPHERVAGATISRSMSNAGFNDLATTLSVRSLVKKNFLAYDMVSNEDYEKYAVYSLTETGEAWLIDNQGRFDLKVAMRKKENDGNDPLSGDVPF
jgi:nucleoside 2-deoxyribosyltransferase